MDCIPHHYFLLIIMPQLAHHVMLNFQWLLAVDISRAYVPTCSSSVGGDDITKTHHEAQQCFHKSPSEKGCDKGNFTLFLNSCGNLVRYFIKKIKIAKFIL